MDFSDKNTHCSTARKTNTYINFKKNRMIPKYVMIIVASVVVGILIAVLYANVPRVFHNAIEKSNSVIQNIDTQAQNIIPNGLP